VATTAVSERLQAAMNAHDIDAFVDCFADDYRSEQPAHPDRAFGGRGQVRANWSEIFAEVPTSKENSFAWRSRRGKSGASGESLERPNGSKMEMRGVIINGIRESRIVWARLYLEMVEGGGAGIAAAVHRITGKD